MKHLLADLWLAVGVPLTPWVVLVKTTRTTSTTFTGITRSAFRRLNRSFGGRKRFKDNTKTNGMD